MTATRNDDRYGKFLELMVVNKYNVTKSAIEAGFSPTYAGSKQKYIMQQAIKYRLEKAGIQVAKVHDLTTPQAKKTMAEIVGFSREELMNNLRFLATQEKDMSVRLRVVAPLAREYGVNLDPEKETTIVPTLNITVRERSIPGSTEPQIES